MQYNQIQSKVLDMISDLGKLNLFKSSKGESSPSLFGFASVKNFHILNAAFQKAPQLKDSRLSKCQRRLLQEMWYLCYLQYMLRIRDIIESFHKTVMSLLFTLTNCY